MSVTNISKNLVQYNKTTHNDIHHHLIMKLVDNKKITIKHVGTVKKRLIYSQKTLILINLRISDLL